MNLFEKRLRGMSYYEVLQCPPRTNLELIQWLRTVNDKSHGNMPSWGVGHGRALTDEELKALTPYIEKNIPADYEGVISLWDFANFVQLEGLFWINSSTRIATASHTDISVALLDDDKYWVAHQITRDDWVRNDLLHHIHAFWNERSNILVINTGRR